MQNITVVFNKTGHKVEINLERQVTYLTGSSGVGKTTLVELLKYGDELRFIVSSSLPLEFLYAFNSLNLITVAKNCILVVDDYASLQSTSFWRLVNEYLVKNNLWVVIVGREGVGSFSSALYDTYVMERNGSEFCVSKREVI